ncbi:MAG: 30S ribosomal protein S8 [Thermoleophilia bacterium]|nr:30S ribosomal protein S8 [Thermoleophilia bacterium]
MLTDPIADMLTRVRNSLAALHDQAEMPSSKLKERVASLLTDEGYISGYDVDDSDRLPVLRVTLKYDEDRRPAISGLRRESSPGRRVYVQVDGIPKIQGGMGTAVMSTSRGVITGHHARRLGVGGEVLCSVW